MERWASTNEEAWLNHQKNDLVKNGILQNMNLKCKINFEYFEGNRKELFSSKSQMILK